ncbi:hypothetical protein BGZ98_001326, partial [Dissophora globulifera]
MADHISSPPASYNDSPLRYDNTPAAPTASYPPATHLAYDSPAYNDTNYSSIYPTSMSNTISQPHPNNTEHPLYAEESLRQNLQTNQYRVPRSPLAAPPPQPQQQQQQHSDSHGLKPASFYPLKPLSHTRPEYDDNDHYDGHDKRLSGTVSTRITRLFRFPSSAYGKAMMLTIGFEALLVIILQAIIVSLYFQSLLTTWMPPATDGPNAGVSIPPYLDSRNQSRSIPAYLIVFVFAQLFQLVFAWDAVRAQNTIEVIGIVIFNLCCFAYSIFEISQIQKTLWDAGENGFFTSTDSAMDLNSAVKPFLITVVCIIGVTQCLVTWLAYRLFQEFGWKIYKKIGADPNMKKMYRAYQIYLVLIKVDLFFFVGFSIQFIYLTLTRRGGDPEYWITISVLPITILILYVAIYAVRHESRRWMATFIGAMLCGVVYFVFKVIRMYVGPKKENYDGVVKFLTLFATLCLITILVTIGNATVCYKNFGKGLKPHLVREGSESPNTASSPEDR